MHIFLSLCVCGFVNLVAWLLGVSLLTYSQTMSLFLIFVLLFTFMDIAESLRKIADKKGVTFNYYTVQRTEPSECKEM